MSLRASLKNLIRRDTERPSLRERAADLQADLSRVARQPEPQADPEPTDWDSPPPGFIAYPEREPMSFLNIPEGLRLELERLRNVAELEFERVTEMADGGLHVAVRAGMEDRLRRRLRLDGIEAALAPEMPVSAGIEDRAGLVYYEDAAGKTHRRPVADWIGFMAQRLYTVARQEMSRQFNAQCGGLDEAGNRVLDAKLRRELRIDALFALTFHSHKVFEVAELKRYGSEEEIAAAAPVIEADLPKSAISLVGMLDLASATMDDLRMIRDLAERVGSVAYANAWRPVCHKSSHPLGASDYNDAGKLMHWLGDALTGVESAAEKEAQRRAPVDDLDRETRLSMLAVRTIDNGEPDKIETFARELLAHAEAERAGR